MAEVLAKWAKPGQKRGHVNNLFVTCRPAQKGHPLSHAATPSEPETYMPASVARTNYRHIRHRAQQNFGGFDLPDPECAQ